MRDYFSNLPVIFARCTLSAYLAAALLSGCSGSHPVNFVPDESAAPSEALSSGTSSGYVSLYSFKGGTDGEAPTASLTALDGKLYGTTTAGGRRRCDSDDGCGTVFEVTARGDERIVYAFKGSDGNCDGLGPTGRLVVLAGLLYGVTPWGGCADGTVFSVGLSGNEKVLHRFISAKAGEIPYGGPTLMNGLLYDTATQGGDRVCRPFAQGCGTVFAMSTSGKERLLYGFKKARDGLQPDGVVAIGKRLYGTTAMGGRYNLGTVFAIDSSGTERVLHNFAGKEDGAYPEPGLTVVNGVLYGTTAQGGNSVGSYLAGVGTVFSVSPGGTEKIVYRFGAPGDGITPNGMLTFVDGALYGTTQTGGGTDACYGEGYPAGCGTVFKVLPSGDEQIVYRFTGSPDGFDPVAGLTFFNGELYGTTNLGGISQCGYGRGCGTVFKLAP
jgi:uncharacterized repeat protein (TIGR03803 family)